MEKREFAELIEALEMREPRAGCLTDDQLAALASRAVGEVDAAALRSHLLSCLPCLQAYASLGAVLDLPVGTAAAESGGRGESARARLSRVSRDIAARARRALAVPVPLSWSAGAAVAAALLMYAVALRTGMPEAPTAPPAAPPATTADRAPGGPAADDVRKAATSSSPCGSKRWRIESVITKNLISHLFVCGDGGPDDAVYVISGRPSEVTQRPGQTSAILEQARIQRLDAS